VSDHFAKLPSAYNANADRPSKNERVITCAHCSWQVIAAALKIFQIQMG
jgi:hypothetical protein